MFNQDNQAIITGEEALRIEELVTLLGMSEVGPNTQQHLLEMVRKNPKGKPLDVLTESYRHLIHLLDEKLAPRKLGRELMATAFSELVDPNLITAVMNSLNVEEKGLANSHRHLNTEREIMGLAMVYPAFGATQILDLYRSYRKTTDQHTGEMGRSRWSDTRAHADLGVAIGSPQEQVAGVGQTPGAWGQDARDAAMSQQHSWYSHPGHTYGYGNPSELVDTLTRVRGVPFTDAEIRQMLSDLEAVNVGQVAATKTSMVQVQYVVKGIVLQAPEAYQVHQQLYTAPNNRFSGDRNEKADNSGAGSGR